MMFLVRIFATAVVAAHSALGCCWHHQHAYADRGDAAEMRSACCHGHNESAQQHSGNHEHGGSNHPPHNLPCDEGQCVFVRDIAPDSIEPVDSGGEPLGIVVVCDECPAVTNSPDQRTLWLHGASPPVRPHLLKQVFLL